MSRNAWNALGVTVGIMLTIGLVDYREVYFFAAGALYGVWWLVLMEWMQARSAHSDARPVPEADPRHAKRPD